MRPGLAAACAAAAIVVMLGVATPAAAGPTSCTPKAWERAKKFYNRGFDRHLFGGHPSYPLTTFVRDSYWWQMSFAQKASFAETIVCALAGPGKTLVYYKFQSLSTGALLGEWDLGRLKVP